ncbi:MAG TPA: hypothetical protein VGY57_10060 [Vicinamibacterales bacterium]|nr:hypothetical protein [Vicinamibacterales bacterium]
MTIALCALAGSPTAQTPKPNFRFQNNFWVNLHHTLRGESRRRDFRAPAMIKTNGLKPEERAAWTLALDAYVEYTRRDLAFDAPLIRLNNALSQIPDDTPPTRLPSGLDAAARRGLIIGAPIYRAHFWAAQQLLNDRWIAALTPAIAEHGAATAAALARAYRVEWPTNPIVVDAASEAGPNNAYTVDGPAGTAAHTTIESANPDLQGDMAFEIVFHEASHARGIDDRISAALSAEAERQHAALPRDLWHALIFYTVGEVVRRELGKAGDADYKPFAYRYGVYTRGWQKLRDALVRDWQPYLDGKTSYDEALAALVRDAA